MKRAALGLLFGMGLHALPALADPPSDLERAKQSFKAGATAYAAGDYLAAIQALDAAYQLTPLPAIAFSLGQAERKQYFVDHGRAHLDRAISLFRKYVELSPVGSRRADALDALSQLEPLAATEASAAAPAVPRAEEPVRRTRLLITSDAPGARLALDGAPAVASPLIREVLPGKHRVLVEALGFFASQRDVTAVAGELILAPVPLRERPSTLGIWTAADAEIYVDGAFLSQGGKGVLLELASGKHRLAVGQKGHGVALRELTLERGQAQAVRIELEPTAQRISADALFIGGGAALGASLVFSALTVRSEGQAEAFLGRRAHGNVSSAELYGYNASLSDRNRYRIGTAVCLAAAAGFWITGLFLHELDQPNPQTLYRTAPPSGARLPPPTPPARRFPVQVAPSLSANGFGALLGGVF
jgi:tetratricopeptide (TPR) repeat protein